MAIYSPKKIIRNIIGTILILLGIVGLFLPILQGVLLIFLGITVLDFDKKEALLAKLKQNHYLQRLRSYLPKR
ncbi:MAG: hypothetical protein A3G93_16260 [Nitrospinae bacterium RIFCSPLOWO2_12_FULL_45_22]|nr:MAG: hypothetical protein A3G93_16260 [Nitrospinae bacterium RIFCSPLOWO2_12_FULL_45_22]